MAARPNIRMRPLVSSTLPQDSDEVYYLRTSIPAFHDIAISGPFHVLGAALPNLLARLADSSEGTELFNAATENGRLLNQFCHVTGPIDGSPEHSVQVELLRVRDAALRRILPGPLYKVIAAEPFLDAAGQMSQSPRRGGGICVEDMQLVGSYVSAADARDRANRGLVARLAHYQAAFPKLVGAVEEGRDAMGIIIAFEDGSTPTVPFVVMVSYDSGVMLDSHGNEMRF